MKNKIIRKFIIIFSVIFLANSCQGHKEIYIKIYNEEQGELLKNFILYKNYDVELSEETNYMIINKINKNILMEMIDILYLKIQIIEDNIANVNTTRTANGGPFIRKYIKITIENGIEIIDDMQIKSVYDPAHPDAIESGIEQGYVKFPNIDIMYEYYDLRETIILYNAIVDHIQNNYKNIIIEKRE
jgi:flagellar basal-body rod protein FlgC